jgi:hypothetical protein
MENIDPNSTGAAPKKKRTGLIIGGVIVLVILLAGAAFVGGQLLNQQQAKGSNGGFTVNGGPGGDQKFTVQLQPAKELPATAPDARGIFASRKDNSIFVTQGDKFMAMVNKDGSVQTQTDGNGQQIEIVVTTDTTIYKDATVPPDIKSGSFSGTLQQQVAPGSIDEISANTFVSAWGERRGDRLIAKVLVYSQPCTAHVPAP